MIIAFRIIRERFKKQYQRGNGPKLLGIKSLEFNFNPAQRTYNPHFDAIGANELPRSRANEVSIKKLL